MNASFAALAYLVSGVLFILSLRGLSSPETSRQGNTFGMVGMALAVGVTLLTLWSTGTLDPLTLALIAGGVIVGGGAGALIAARVQMTQMPQLVAAFHSLVGMAACLVAVGAVYAPESFGIADGAGGIKIQSIIELALGVAIGAITFTGSVIDIFRAMTLTGARDPANLHPDGKVPALLHDDALVTESAAIALYLTDLHPDANLGAPVGSPDRAAYVTWLAWTAGEMEPAFWSKISGAAETDPNAKARYDAAIARLMTALATGPYLMGDRFTAVDVMIASALAWGREYVPESALVDAYLERALTRPANTRAAAKDGDLPGSVQAA